MDCTAAVAALRNNTTHFLKYYPVKCAGAAAPAQNAANLKIYNITKLGGLVAGAKVGHRGATRPGLFGREKEISSFKLAPGNLIPANADSALVNQVHVVPMVNHNSDIYGCLNLNGVINAMPHYVLDGTGDGIMVTGELSNCCFCWIEQGAQLWCIHVQPVGGIMPLPLQNALALHGHFGAAPVAALNTFGRNDYPGGRASVIGVRHAGVWNLYAQKAPDAHFATLTEANRIHPAPAVRL